MSGISTMEAILGYINSENIFLNGTLDIAALLHEIQCYSDSLLGIGYLEIVESCNDLFNMTYSKWIEGHGNLQEGMREFFKSEAHKLEVDGDCEHAKALLLMFDRYLDN